MSKASGGPLNAATTAHVISGVARGDVSHRTNPVVGILLATIVALGFLLRFALLYASGFVIDSDEAIVGLMAKHILEGDAVPVFYYGQHYMGSLEALLVAALAMVFGLSVVTLKIVPLLCSVALIPVTFLLGRRCGGDRAGLAAALAMAAAPSPLLVWSSKARGGFIEVVLIGALALLAISIWTQGAPRRLRTLAAAGVLLGIGWWVNNQIIYFMLPIGAWCLVVIASDSAREKSERVREALVSGVVGVLAWFLGGAPFWWYNFTHDFASFGIFGPANSGDFLTHLRGFFGEALPILLGAKGFWDAHESFPHATLVGVVVLMLAVCVPIAIRARDLKEGIPVRALLRTPLELYLLMLLACAAVFALSSFGWLSRAPRYLLPLYVPLYVLIGFVVSRVPRGVGSTLLVLLFVLAGASNFRRDGWAIPGEPFVHAQERVSKNHEELIGWLDAHGITWVRTNYWIGYRLAFETGERIRFRVFGEPRQERIVEYREAMPDSALRTVPFVLVPSEARLVERALRLEGRSYQRAQVSGYVVLFDVDVGNPPCIPIERSALHGEANFSTEGAAGALDGHLGTRWGSGHPQSPEMEFEVNLAAPRAVSAIEIEQGTWLSDSPRSLAIDVKEVGGEWREVASPADVESLKYLQDREGLLGLVLQGEKIDGVRLRQNGRDPVFDWSIAELRLCESGGGG